VATVHSTHGTEVHDTSAHEPDLDWQRSGVSVIEMTPEEWRASAQREFDRLNVTFEELAEQSRRNDYETHDHFALWVALGGKKP
jgi:hypothetical protein